MASTSAPGKGAAPRSAPGWAGTPDASGAGPALPLTRSFFRVANIFPSVHGPCGLALPLRGIQRLHSVNAKGSCRVGAGQVPGHSTSCPPSPFLCQMAGGGLQLATRSVGKSNLSSPPAPPGPLLSVPSDQLSPGLPGWGPPEAPSAFSMAPSSWSPNSSRPARGLSAGAGRAAGNAGAWGRDRPAAGET